MNFLRKILTRFLGYFNHKYIPYCTYFDYYENLSEQLNLHNLIHSFSNKSINNVNTDKKISFYRLPFHTDIKSIIKKIGKPKYKIQHTTIKNLSNLYYRKKLGNLKVTVMLNILNHKMISGSYIFDTFNEKSFCEIKAQINSKYLNFQNTENKSITITDMDLNRIEIIHNVDYRINFISGDNTILQTLNELSVREKQLLYVESKSVIYDYI